MKKIFKIINRFFKELSKEEGFTIFAVVATACLTTLFVMGFKNY